MSCQQLAQWRDRDNYTTEINSKPLYTRELSRLFFRRPTKLKSRHYPKVLSRPAKHEQSDGRGIIVSFVARVWAAPMPESSRDRTSDGARRRRRQT